MPSQIILFSHPRTGCHFLERMVFSKQPNLKQSWHPLTATSQVSYMINDWMKQDSPEDLYSNDTSNIKLEAQKGVDLWRETFESAGNHIHYVHEHPCFIYTPERIRDVILSKPPPTLRDEHLLVPKQLLLHPGTIPVFTIRHPVLQVQSSYKAVNTVFSDCSPTNHFFAANLSWGRDLYDWYVQHGVKPVVLDADDYMASEEFVRHATAELGLDPQAAIVKWPAMSEKERDEMHPVLVKMQETLVTSEGLVQGRSGKHRDLDAEVRGWQEKYSTEVVKMLEGFVQAAMPHYEYLRERKLQM